MNSAVASFRTHVQRIKDSNNDVFPPTLASFYISYLETMRNELRSIMDIIDEGRFLSGFEDMGNMTLDDVEIPKSLLDDGLEVSFIDEQVVEVPEFSNSRPSSVASSEYFSALEDNQFETESVNSVDDDFFGNKVTPQDDLAGEIERDLLDLDEAASLEPDTDEPESDLVEILPPMSPPRFRFDDIYLDSNNTRNTDNSSPSLVSSFSQSDHEQVKTPLINSSKEKDNIESPPPSPITKENSMDAITAALQAMEIASNKTGETTSSNFNELDTVDEAVEKNQIECDQSAEDKRSFIPRPIHSKNKSDNAGSENSKKNIIEELILKQTPRSPLKPKNEFETQKY